MLWVQSNSVMSKMPFFLVRETHSITPIHKSRVSIKGFERCLSCISGPSSTIAFIGDIRSATGIFSNPVAQEDIPEDPQRHIGKTYLSQSRPGSPGSPLTPISDRELTSIDAHIVPDEQQVRSLLDQYFSNTNILYPFIHQPSFLATYDNALKSNFDGIRRTWLGLLNVLMAIGATVSTKADTNSEARIQSAEVFYERAFKLCYHKGYVLRRTCLETGRKLLM
jgi:hypothetical protein